VASARRNQRLFLGSQGQAQKKEDGASGYEITRWDAGSRAVDGVPNQPKVGGIPIKEDDSRNN